jgi:hypothetical protein
MPAPVASRPDMPGYFTGSPTRWTFETPASHS